VAGARAVMALSALVRLVGSVVLYPVRPSASRKQIAEFSHFLHRALTAPVPTPPAPLRGDRDEDV
jgi:hypothetical protein